MPDEPTPRRDTDRDVNRDRDRNVDRDIGRRVDRDILRPDRDRRPGRKADPTLQLKEPPLLEIERPALDVRRPRTGGKLDREPPVAEGRKAPVLLLPVRLETCFVRKGRELIVRIFPDQVHVDSDDPGLTKAEIEAASSFWRQIGATPRGEHGAAERDALWSALCGAVGPNRAGHVARTVRDRPGVGPRTTDPAATVRLLPDRWIVLGFRGDDLVVTKRGNPVRHGLETSPDASSNAVQIGDSGLQVSPGLSWMFDIEVAEKVGMAVRITDDDLDDVDAGFTTLLAIGVRDEDPTLGAEQLAELLEMHERSSGLAFVESGTHTNNLVDRPSPWRHRLRPDPSVVTADADPDKLAGRTAAEFARALGLPDVGALARLDGARTSHREHVRHLHRAVAEPLLTHYVRELLGSDQAPGLAPAPLHELRQWFIEHVTGGDPLPTIRIGPQPYAVLPVGLPPTSKSGGVPGQIARFVDALMPGWQRALAGVPRIDPNATDTVTLGDDDDAQPVDLIPAVIASQPHAARLLTRTFYPRAEDFWGFLSPATIYAYLRHTWLPDEYPELEPYAQSVDGLGTSVQTQISLWQLARSIVESESDPNDGIGFDIAPARRAGALAAIDSMLTVLSGWEYRQRPQQDLDLPTWNGALGHPAPPRLVDGRFGDEREWADEQLVGPVDAPDELRPPAYLTALADRYQSGTPSSPDFEGREPLLHQLLALGETTLAGTARRNATATSLRLLAQLAGRTDGHERLDRLVRQSLGLVTHRLDAWATSVHTARLAELRGDEGAPEGGLVIGGYGVVRDLVPAGKRHSSGFVLAPSLAHASTAAVLRAAWLSHGSSAPDSAAAVDLTSARLRTASWVLDGIRNGQSLGELLGYRFERYLHDHGGSAAIHGVRAQVIDGRIGNGGAGGRPVERGDTTINEPVDGLEVLDAADALDHAAFGNQAAVVTEALAEIAAVADAVADAALFDGTHQIVSGNPARAAAMFDSVSLGQGTPPELRSHLVRPGGTTIDHRIAVVLDADATPDTTGSWSPGLRDRLCPPLEAWVRSLLPDPSQVAVVVASATTGEVTTLALADLGLSALDAVALATGDPGQLILPMQALVRLRADVADDVQLVATPPNEPSRPPGRGLTAPVDGRAPTITFDEFQVLAREINGVLERAVPATAATLQPPTGEVDTSATTGVPEAIVMELFEQFTAAVRGPQPDAALVSQFGWPVGVDPTDTLGRLREQLARMRRGWQRAKDPDRLLAELFPQTPTVLPAFVHSATAEGGRIDLSRSDALASADEAEDWLAAMGRVRDDVGRLRATDLLAGIVGDRGVGLAVGQDVVEAGERWAAIAPPPAEANGRTSMCAITLDRWVPSPGDRCVGLAIDGWSERIPSQDQVGGVAFHFDAPSNRAPQAWLLAVPDGDTPWTHGVLADVVLDTLDWAELRMVAPEDFVEWGHALPLSMLPGTVRHWPDDDGGDT